MGLIRVGTHAHVNPQYIESVTVVGTTARMTVVQMQSGRSITTTESVDTIVERINLHMEAS